MFLTMYLILTTNNVFVDRIEKFTVYKQVADRLYASQVKNLQKPKYFKSSEQSRSYTKHWSVFSLIKANVDVFKWRR